MKYKEKIIAVIDDEDDDALVNYLQTLVPTEQLIFLQEFKDFATEVMLKSEDYSAVEMLRLFQERLDHYEDAVLAEIQAEKNYKKALEEQEKVMADIDVRRALIREYVIECIVTNAENAPEMKQLAVQVRELEKDYGDYDPNNWTALEGLI
jgi:hypothetical protein